MTPRTGRLLALAIRQRRLAMVYLCQGVPQDCRMSRCGGTGPDAAVATLREWLAFYRPDIVVSCNPDAPGRKGKHAVAVLLALSQAMADARPRDILVPRIRRHKNIFDEAKVLDELYPGLNKPVPKKPPIWDSEPRTMVYFEALALAHEVLG